jgi:hypothetical protein
MFVILRGAKGLQVTGGWLPGGRFTQHGKYRKSFPDPKLTLINSLKNNYYPYNGLTGGYVLFSFSMYDYLVVKEGQEWDPFDTSVRIVVM